MTTEELGSIIKSFDTDGLKEKGTFGIFQYGGGPDESFIRANTEGLKLFALELLQSALEADEVLENENLKSIPLNLEQDWINQDSDTFIDFVEPIANKPIINQEAAANDQLFFQIGCVLLLIFLTVSIVIGIGTLVSWIF